MLKDILQGRQQQLGLTTYAIAKAMAEKRGTGSASNLNSSVTNAFNEPEGRSFALIKEVIEALGGKIVIQWQEIKEVEL
jgi:hypothetical protein